MDVMIEKGLQLKIRKAWEGHVFWNVKSMEIMIEKRVQQLIQKT